MYTSTNVERKRRGGFTSVVLAALVTGGSFGLVPAAAGTPDAISPDLAISVTPPAVPGVPDVGEPGEGSGQQLVPTIDPHGNLVWPTRDEPAATIRDQVTRGDWTEVIAVVDGARIRTQPVTGTVVGLISKGAYFSINCQTRAADGYVWGYARHQRRYGWVRSDLWEIVRYTAPNALSPRPIPWC
jgi:hypothetical protein